MLVALLITLSGQNLGEIVQGPPGYSDCRVVMVGRQGEGGMERGLHCRRDSDNRLELLRGQAAEVPAPPSPPAPVQQMAAVSTPAPVALPTRQQVEASMQGRPYTQVVAEQQTQERAERAAAARVATASATRTASTAQRSQVSASGGPTADAIRDLSLAYTVETDPRFRATGVPGEYAMTAPLVGDFVKIRRSISDVQCAVRGRGVHRCSYTITQQLKSADNSNFVGAIGAMYQSMFQAAGADVRSARVTWDFTRQGSRWVSPAMREAFLRDAQMASRTASASSTPQNTPGIDFQAMQDMWDAAEGDLW